RVLAVERWRQDRDRNAGRPATAGRQRTPPPRRATRDPCGPIRTDATHRHRRPPRRTANDRRLRAAGGVATAIPRRHAAAAPTRRPHDRYAMSVSSPFIFRPIATSLLGVAVMLGGILGYFLLPVASLPQVDFPTIQVTTQLPGANAETIASLVTAPLERQFGQIPALVTMTSSSSYGVSQITLQFELSREIDAAAQDVQAAINAAGSALPRKLPHPAGSSHVDPARAPAP